MNFGSATEQEWMQFDANVYKGLQRHFNWRNEQM